MISQQFNKDNLSNKDQKINIRKMAVTIVAAILLIMLYCFIFGFSEQDGDESANSSYEFTLACTEIINHIIGEPMTKPTMESIAAYFEHPVRKLAHFTEYACMGILVNVILIQYLSTKKKRFLLSTTWVFLSASIDEIHQLFVPGRYGNFADVLLDTSGGITGFLLLQFVLFLFFTRKHKNNDLN